MEKRREYKTLNIATSKRILSIAIIATMLISTFAIFPIAQVQAAAADVTVSIDYPYIQIGTYSTNPTRTITISNPLGNPGITRIEIQVPAAAADEAPTGDFAVGFVNTGTVNTAGSGPWVLIYPGSSAGAVILPAGAAGKLTISIDPENSVSTTGVVDAYTFTVTIFFEGGASQVQTLTIYEGEASSTGVIVTTTGTLKVGQPISLKVTLDTACQGIPLKLVRTAPTTLPSGFTDSFTPATVTTGTSNDPAATATYTSTYATTAYRIKATVGTIDSYSNNIGTLNEVPCDAFNIAAESPTKVLINVPGGDLTKPINYITDKRVKGITVSLADTYNNPVSVDVASEFSLFVSPGTLSIGKETKVPIAEGRSATPISIATAGTYPQSYIGPIEKTTQSDGLSGTYYYAVTAINNNGETMIQPSGTEPNTAHTLSNEKITLTWENVTGANYYRVYRKTSTIAGGDDCDVITLVPNVNLTFVSGKPTFTDMTGTTWGTGKAPTSDTATWIDFIPDSYYGKSAVITATITLPSVSIYAGTYSGGSRSLVTSTFATSVTVSTKDGVTNVKAGKTLEITATLNVAQEGVPITFSLSDYSEGYAGSLSAATALTDSDGKAKVVLTVDTKADASTAVKATVPKPTTADPTNKFSGTSATITTDPGDPAKLVVKTYEYKTPVPTNLADLTAKSSVIKGGKLFVAVLLADAYGNPASNTLGVSIQVSLSATAGSLSTTTAYIASGEADTWSGYKILFTAPNEVGNVTITATTPQGLTAGSTIVQVFSLEPLVTITQPAADSTIQTNETSITVYIAGYAKVSPGQPTGTAISEIKYSLNGAENVSVPILSVVEGKYNFNFTVTLAANSTNSIVVYAKDTLDYVGFATRQITVTPLLPAPVHPAEVSEAKTLDATGSPKTSFRMGETVIASANVTNVDTVSHSMLIAVQVKDPDGTVLPTQYVMVTLVPGQSIAPALSSIIPATGYRAGTWTAKIMVLTTWPAQGGVSISEPVEMTFTVVS
jgi:hypothetical protein